MGGTIITPWTSADREKCLRLAMDGCSGSEIAKELGRPRNAIIGILHRAGVPLLGHLRAKAEKPPRAPSLPKPRARVKPPTSLPKPPQPLKPEPPMPEIKPKKRGEYGPTSFTETRLDQCMWVTHASRNNNRAIVCGEAVKKIGCRWCAEHYSIVYLPPSDRKQAVRAMDYGAKKWGTR